MGQKNWFNELYLKVFSIPLDIYRSIQKKSRWFILFTILIIAAILVAGIGILSVTGPQFPFFDNQLQKKLFPDNKLPSPSAAIKKDSVNISEDGGDKIDIFNAQLEYNPVTGVVSQLRAEKKKGDSPWPLLSKLPEGGVSPSMFAYKIEVWDRKQQIVFDGWILGYKRIIKTDKGNLKLSFVIPYKANSLVKVYLQDNKLIWTGKTD